MCPDVERSRLFGWMCLIPHVLSEPKLRVVAIQSHGPIALHAKSEALRKFVRRRNAAVQNRPLPAGGATKQILERRNQ